MIRNIIDVIWIHIAQQGALLFCFSQNFSDISISDSIVWNPTKFCMLYTYFERFNQHSFYGHSLLVGAIARIFPKVLGKSGFCEFLIKIIYFRCMQLNWGCCCSVFSKMHVTIVSQLLLHRINKILYEILTLHS